MESKKVVQHVYLVGAKSIYRVAEKDEEYLRDEEEKNQNTACGASCWRRGSLHPNASQVFGSMHIRAAFIIASEAIYSPSAEYKRVPDKIINKAKQWSEQYPKKIEFQEAYFGLLFSRLKYAQAQDMRNEQRRVYREMKTVAERANYSEYNESNQLMESVDILHRVFGY